ncbi:Decarboxylase NovR [compost metagenome]
MADLGPTQRALILRNHGLVTLGRSVAEAFILMHNLERACRVQVAIQGTGQPVNPVPEAVCELTARQYASGDTNRLASAPTDPYAREWSALLQRLEPPTATSFRA